MPTKLMRLVGSMAATIFLAVLFFIPAEASEHVRGHVTKNGKYVAPHNRSNANKTQRDNWSSKGNTNPYTGKRGHKNAKK
jgi:hypothetical protein